MPHLSDLPPGVNPLDPHIVGSDEPEVIVNEANKTWEAEDREGFYWFFKGNWFAMDTNDAGERDAPEGRSRISPEDAVLDLLEQIDQRGDHWPEDFALDR